MINIPFKAPWLGENKWITVPPQNYGGIQWIVKNLMDGMLELGHSVTLLGAPGSPETHPKLTVLPHGEIKDIEKWLEENEGKYDIVHDHTCRGEEFNENFSQFNWKVINSHYLSSVPLRKKNIVAASQAHAKDIGMPNVPFIRHPVNPNNYVFTENKSNYLLFLGRVSDWKGAYEAASFAEKAGLKLVIAGPVWEKEYFEAIMSRYKKTVRYVGEVGGEKRLELLSRSKAILVFSNSVTGPAGRTWVEPGSTVVSEAAACGTPVISSSNGCLSEIVPRVGKVIDDLEVVTQEEARGIIQNLPLPSDVYRNGLEDWDYLKISEQYLQLYEKVLHGHTW